MQNTSLQAENIILAQCSKPTKQQCTPRHGKYSSDGMKKYKKSLINL